MTARADALFDPDDDQELRRWSVAAAIVLVVHFGLAALYLLQHSREPLGSREAPAVIVDLAPLAVAPPSQQDLAPGPEMPPPEPEVLRPPRQLEPEPVPTERPLVALPEPKPAEKTPERMRQEQVQTAPPKAERTATAPAAPNVGTYGANAVSPTWVSLLMAHLNRHKRYPNSARERREQGVVTLNFTVDRDGHVLAQRVAKSSGSNALDDEALAMIQRAQPLPPFPRSMVGSSRTFNAPIKFSME